MTAITRVVRVRERVIWRPSPKTHTMKTNEEEDEEMGEVERANLRVEKWTDESMEKTEERIQQLEKEADEEEAAAEEDRRIERM